MIDKAIELRRTAEEIESYSYSGNSKKVFDLLDKLIDDAVIMRRKLAKTVQKKEVSMEELSAMKFLCKPVIKHNYYDGDYLEEFSKERTKELKMVSALKVHNEFWTAYNVERGNVFGSIPEELIKREHSDTLILYGWKRVEVKIYECDKKASVEDIEATCRMKFKNYLIVKEQQTKANMVLEYNL